MRTDPVVPELKPDSHTTSDPVSNFTMCNINIFSILLFQFFSNNKLIK